MIFIFYLKKRLLITKDSVVKIQNLVVNHESRPVKATPALKRLKEKIPPEKSPPGSKPNPIPNLTLTRHGGIFS